MMDARDDIDRNEFDDDQPLENEPLSSEINASSSEE